MWLLENKIYSKMEKAIESGFAASKEQKVEFASYNAKAEVLTTKATTAIINIDGSLTKQPNIIAMLFGGGNTTYLDIIDALNNASSDDKIDNIQLNIDSPGGNIDGLFDTVEVLKKIEKPIIAKVDGMATSAAYAIAAQADEIIASNRASEVGSIGVAASIRASDDMIDVTSTNAPKKRPDVTTTEGKAVVREYLDSVESLFIESIANGRNTTMDKVKKNFGQGAIILADEAKSRGMIDSIVGAKNTTVVSASTSGQKNNKTLGVRKMDLNELRIEHKDIFAEAKDIGMKKERDRVEGHLTMGQSSGDMETAIEAIKKGTNMTDALSAKYMSAGIIKAAKEATMNKSDKEKGVTDNPAAIAPQDPVAKDIDKEAVTAENIVAKLEAEVKK